MNRNVVFSIVALAAIIILIGGWYALARNKPASPVANNNTANTTDNNMGSNMTSHTNTQAPAATDAVVMQGMAFSPADITVKKGSAVTWTNKDDVAHTVTENDGQSGPLSSDVAPGATYSFTFANAGTYHYHCAIHPNMTGTVTVTE